VRQVVVRQVPKTIGRQISIEDIDLNLFTGYMAVKKLRLTERDGRQTFVEFERLEARLALWGLVGRNIRVREFRLVAPDDAFLSPAHERETAYVAVHKYQGVPWEPYFRAVEDVFVSRTARPRASAICGALTKLTGSSEIGVKSPLRTDRPRMRQS